MTALLCMECKGCVHQQREVLPVCGEWAKAPSPQFHHQPFWCFSDSLLFLLWYWKRRAEREKESKNRTMTIRGSRPHNFNVYTRKLLYNSCAIRTVFMALWRKCRQRNNNSTQYQNQFLHFTFTCFLQRISIPATC